MDLIKTDANGREIGYVMNANIDFEIGDNDDSINDFEVEFKRWHWDGTIDYESRLYSPGTEFGGIVKQLGTNTQSNSIIARGYTWRGMLTKKIIQPPHGADYAVVSGEINLIVKQLVEREFPGLFFGVTDSTGVYVENYQFERYCTLHEGIKKMLKSVGFKIDIRYMEGAIGQPGRVVVKAVPVVDYSGEYELTNDDNMSFTTDDNRRGVNHLICLGKGELKGRLVLHLYIDKFGNISETQYFTGEKEICEVYDSNGSEYSDLLKNGTEHLEKIRNRMSYNMTMTKFEESVDIGDIVGGKDYLTGMTVKKPIGRKIWTIASGKEAIEYKLEGES